MPRSQVRTDYGFGLGSEGLQPRTPPHHVTPEGEGASRQDYLASGASAQANVPPRSAEPMAPQATPPQSGPAPARPDATNGTPSGHSIPQGPLGQVFPGPSGQVFPGPLGQAFPRPSGQAFLGLGQVPPGPSGHTGPSGQNLSGPSGHVFQGSLNQTFQGHTGQSHLASSTQVPQGPAAQSYQIPQGQGYGGVNGPATHQYPSGTYGAHPSGGMHGNQQTRQAQQYYASQFTVPPQGVPQGSSMLCHLPDHTARTVGGPRITERPGTTVSRRKHRKFTIRGLDTKLPTPEGPEVPFPFGDIQRKKRPRRLPRSI
uniref:pre-mRNA 3' end processing protein WDR33-like n=1 Tax=Erigeron canadensis TaxID=72917 RepID=UPI001CB9B587|nr:pre-mRNA 3' end processing protein WDR33-like [Erigeron canadensis]